MNLQQPLWCYDFPDLYQIHVVSFTIVQNNLIYSFSFLLALTLQILILLKRLLEQQKVG